MTPERIEQERKAFEEWYASTYLPTPARGRTFNKYPSGVYCLQHVQDAWQAWQARIRQAAEIPPDEDTKGKEMDDLEDKLTVLRNVEEVIKDSKRLDWLMKFCDRLGVFDEDDMKKVGVNGKNFRKFIDLLMVVPIDELLADLEQD